ncbi:Aste57867_22364 [Aphanomyces stellatus]|uniref:Aste57867_22364 protein n=1 Tax=Aphanomyces stellatus TaxID=120398 RepID=A0A485LLT1_9STRA|nr:hypothetical protein As57867_022294 [Aphanomyces stellatus]VFT99027.1 Aste57867_22364 [Aphanomyces stellatus]
MKRPKGLTSAAPRAAPQPTWKDQLHTQPIMQLDFRILWWLYDQKPRYPGVTQAIHSVVSRYRTQDISLLLWLIFFFLVPDLGFPYVWTCVGNLLVALVLQYAIDAKRPIDYDPDLHVYMCTDPDTRGFPSVDSHMAIVVVAPAFFLDSVSLLTCLMLLACVGLIAFSRVFVAARFPSQIVASWATGVLGLCVGDFCHVTMQLYRIPAYYHRVALVCVIVGTLFCIAQYVERNESRSFGLPKAEFTRVLESIINGTDDVGPEHAPSKPERAKRDSFYYLMKAVHNRRRDATTHRTGNGHAPVTPHAAFDEDDDEVVFTDDSDSS